MSKVSEMSAEDRNALRDKLAGVITDHGFRDQLTIKVTRETVCDMKKTDVEDNMTMVIEKMFGPDKKEQVDKLKAALTEAATGVEGVSIKLGVQLGAGCQYDPIKNIVPIKGGDPITLNHTEGEVWLIDFWATWCPPCQGPMAHNQEMLEKREKDWGDKVKIIGISIDQTAEAVVKHCDAKGWNKPIHYHRAKSDCSEQYAVRGVPNVMLIDTKGKIVFKGHPASRPDLEADFDTLLKGEKITGKGTEDEGAPQAKEGAAAPTGKELDSSACLDAITKFKEAAGTALSGNEDVKTHASGMPRAFCVMVYEETYNIGSGKSLVDWKNYRVLVGKQEAIDACKKVIEANVSGDFEVVLREHAI